MPVFRSICVCFLLVSAAVCQSSLRRLNAPNASDTTLCPLKQTTVRAEISGLFSRTTVVQHFLNPFPDTIEAIYTFPLPGDAAVDRMVMIIGERRIQAVIRSREEAAKMYDQARAAGRAAGRLEEQRPNIFTQSVANIVPGTDIQIEISYLHTLKYESSGYEFVFPTVVGPRYTPAELMPVDAALVSPPIASGGSGPGHTLDLEVTVDAGVPIGRIESNSHSIVVRRTSASQARVQLRNGPDSPNRDFVLRYDTAGRTIATSLLTHRSEKGGFFSLTVQPPERAVAADVRPKELIFVLDTSGSMSGRPIEKAKEVMRRALAELNPRDTFNLITFSGSTEILFPVPVPGTPENLQIAQMFLQTRAGQGGTEMMRAIRTALAASADTGRVRIVCFLTDGEVGNDLAILGEIRKNADTRVFAFGIGSAANRFLLDGMAHEGRGEVEYVGPDDDATAAVARFTQRVREPILTDITLDWGTLPVTDVYPSRIPDLFSAKPIVVTGRFTGAASGTVRVHGLSGERDVTIPVEVRLPAQESEHDSLVALWARQRVADLVSQDYAGMQYKNLKAELRDEVRKTGLDHGIVTPYTSFVAVEERAVTFEGEPRRILVPVALPAESGGKATAELAAQAGLTNRADKFVRMSGSGGGIGSGHGVGFGPGSGAGTGGGVYRISGGISSPVPIHKVEPVYTEEARRAGLQGAVLLSAVLGADGVPTNIRVLRPLGLGLDEQAVAAASQWRFRPALKDGKPVATSVNLEVNFRQGSTATSMTPVLSPGELAARLSPELVQVIESGLARDLEVQIQLRSDAPDDTTLLEAAGLIISSPRNSAAQVRGKIASAKLGLLASLTDVRFIVEARRRQ